MESNLVNRRRRLKGQIPDIKSSLIMIDHLREKSAAKEEIESHFLISDQAYSKATIPPTDKVILYFSKSCLKFECLSPYAKAGLGRFIGILVLGMLMAWG